MREAAAVLPVVGTVSVCSTIGYTVTRISKGNLSDGKLLRPRREVAIELYLNRMKGYLSRGQSNYIFWLLEIMGFHCHSHWAAIDPPTLLTLLFARSKFSNTSILDGGMFSRASILLKLWILKSDCMWLFFIYRTFGIFYKLQGKLEIFYVIANLKFYV